MRPIAWMSITILLFLFSHSHALAFDHKHAAWDRLLSKHVRWISDGYASQVDYAGFKKDRAELKKYLKQLSSVSIRDFNSYSRDQRLAFLINSYNAFTIELILTKYPEIESIKDLGSIFTSPWKIKFFTLLGKKRHLDEIEHDMIRRPGVYDEPRIHYAVVCAAIGCPGIRNEAFTAGKLENQLEDSLKRFLSDKSRNRYNRDSGEIEISKIFKWYRGEFEQNRDGLRGFLGRYADGELPEKISYQRYDWSLNGRPPE